MPDESTNASEQRKPKVELLEFKLEALIKGLRSVWELNERARNETYVPHWMRRIPHSV